MGKLDRLTSSICDDININSGNRPSNNTTQVMIDPMTMIMVAKIIIELVRLVKKCRTEESVVNSLKSPSLYERRVTYRIIKKHLTWKEYFSKRHKIAGAIFNNGGEMTEEDVFELFEEIDDDDGNVQYIG